MTTYDSILKQGKLLREQAVMKNRMTKITGSKNNT